MTSVMLRDIVTKAVPNSLQSKVIFDTVQGVESKKPEIVVSGLKDKTGDLVDKPQLNGTHYAPIIADPPIFRKEIGSAMSEESTETVERFIKIPRQLFEDPNWKGMRLKYQRLFLLILENAAYRPRIYKHNGNSITVSPGQFCVSFRRLAEIFNQDVKWKEERIDAPLVQRAVSVFSKFGFSIHESIHGIMRLTITQRELYEHFKKQTDTPSDTQPIQNRYTNEERKEGEDIKETIDRADRSLLLNKKEEEQRTPSIFDAEPVPQNSELSEEKKKIIPELWKFAVNKRVTEGNTACPKPGIKQSDIVNWLKLYEAQDIADAIKIACDKQIKMTYGGYITKLLKEKVPKKKGNIEINDEFLKELMKTHQCTHLENHKQYVTDRVKHTDYQKNTDPKLFKEMIMASLVMAKNYENREPEHTEEREYEDDY